MQDLVHQQYQSSQNLQILINDFKSNLPAAQAVRQAHPSCNQVTLVDVFLMGSFLPKNLITGSALNLELPNDIDSGCTKVQHITSRSNFCLGGSSCWFIVWYLEPQLVKRFIIKISQNQSDWLKGNTPNKQWWYTLGVSSMKQYSMFISNTDQVLHIHQTPSAILNRCLLVEIYVQPQRFFLVSQTGERSRSSHVVAWKNEFKVLKMSPKFSYQNMITFMVSSSAAVIFEFILMVVVHTGEHFTTY